MGGEEGKKGGGLRWLRWRRRGGDERGVCVCGLDGEVSARGVEWRGGGGFDVVLSSSGEG